MKLPYFPFYPQDWSGDARVMGLTLTEKGAYIGLLCAMWNYSSEGNCSVPDSDVYLARVLGISTEEWRGLRATLVDGPAAVLRCEEATLFCPRLRKEWQHAREKSLKATHSAGVRWQGEPKADDAPLYSVPKAPAMRTHSKRNAISEPESDTDTESEKSDSVLSAESTAAVAAPISFADTLDDLLNRCADPLVKNKNAVVVDAFRAVFGTSELSKYPLNAGRLGQLAGQCNGQGALIARIFEFGPAWVKAGRRGDPLDYVTKASHNQNGRANGRSPPLEPHYMDDKQTADYVAVQQAAMDALGDRGMAHPLPRKRT